MSDKRRMGTDENREQVLRLRQVGFPTGSHYYGLQDAKDEDWVVSYEDWEKIVGRNLGEFIPSIGEYGKCDFRSFQILFPDRLLPLNFIIPNTMEMYEGYKKATKLMSYIPSRYISDKKKRVQLFEFLAFTFFKENQ